MPRVAKGISALMLFAKKVCEEFAWRGSVIRDDARRVVILGSWLSAPRYKNHIDYYNDHGWKIAG